MMVTDTAGRALGLLRQLDERSRRKAVERLIHNQHLELCGFTLYKYHLLPRICNECKENQGSSSLPVHYAQVRAGLRWSYFTDEEGDYWAAQTTKLRQGSILPLEPVTYEIFVSGSFTETQTIVSMPGVPPPANSTGDDGRVLFEKHAKAILECSNSAAVEAIAVAELWTRLVGTEQEFWRHVAATLPGKADELSSGCAALERLLDSNTATEEMWRSQPQELKIEIEPQVPLQRTRLALMDLSNSCWASSDEAACNKEASSQAPKSQIKSKNENKRRKREKRKMSRSTPILPEQAPQPKIMAECEKRPRSLLKRKALALQSISSSCREPSGVAGDNDQGIVCRDVHAYPTATEKMRDPRPPKKKLRYDPAKLRSLNTPSNSMPRHVHRNSLSEVSLAELQTSAKFPILHLLTNGRASCLHYFPMVHTIMASIKSIVECYPGMKLDGRHSGVRITYRPDATDVTSIATRLYCMISNCLEMCMDSANVCLHVEHLLRPLVVWNLCLPLWGCVISTLSIVDLATKFEGSYVSCLTFLAHVDIPFAYETRLFSAVLVARQLVQRATNMGASLACFNAVRAPWTWSGLKSCFVTPGLLPAAYEDYVEQMMFWLHREFPELRLTEQMGIVSEALVTP